MAKPFLMFTTRKIIEASSTKLLRSGTISAARAGNIGSISNLQGAEYSSEHFDHSFAASDARNGYESFQSSPALFLTAPWNRNYSTKVASKPKTEKKTGNGAKEAREKRAKTKDKTLELSDSEKICLILNGDVNLEDLVEKLEETGIEMNPILLKQVMAKVSKDAGRKVSRFYKWSIEQPGCDSNLEIFNAVIDFLGRRKDFKAVETLLKENAASGSCDVGGEIGLKTFEIVVERLVKAGREKQAVVFFNKMEEYGFKQNEEAQKIVVQWLCDRGFASYAENLVKSLADTYYPDEEICNTLVKGWCVAGKLNEAKRMVNEMSVGQIAMGVTAYNALLDCICKLCREKDPFRLLPEANKILVEMEAAGVPRNESTFNILITHLCKIRKTEDAYQFFLKMEQYGCSPNFTTYVVLIRSLFQAARVADGHEMLDQMKKAGFEANVKAYFSFIKVLCGIQRVEDAHKVFSTMIRHGCRPGQETFELLVPKLCEIGHTGKAKRLFNKAVAERLMPSSRQDILEQSKVKKPADVKKEKPKRLTLSMIKKKKNLRLKRLRLSFVKKPKSSRRQSY